jgi:hypothetical protein
LSFRLPFIVLAVAANVAVDEPAGTDTLAGIASANLSLLARATENSLEGALFRVTVQVVVSPGSTASGEQVSVLSTAGAASVNEKVRDPPFAAAVTTAVSSAVTTDAVTVKAAVVAVAATVTLAAESAALALLLDRATDTPPTGAAADSVTVQLAVPGAFTVSGVHTSPLTDGSDPTVIESVLLTSPAVAVRVTS